MNYDHYPIGTVAALLQTDLVTPQTSKVLTDRLQKEQIVNPVFFDALNFKILTSVCSRLIPQEDHVQKIDLPGLLDEKLLAGKGKGWRFNRMPPDKTSYKKGLQAINETAESMHGKPFAMLPETMQDELLQEIQSGTAKGKLWDEIPSALFFQELLASITELYYSHPFAKDEIGEVSFADAKGWQNPGLNNPEAHEPLIIKNTEDDESQSAKE